MKYDTAGLFLFFLLLLFYLLFQIWLEGRRDRMKPREISGDTLPEELRQEAKWLLQGDWKHWGQLPRRPCAEGNPHHARGILPDPRKAPCRILFTAYDCIFLVF